jgi:hypothetical protein
MDETLVIDPVLPGPHPHVDIQRFDAAWIEASAGAKAPKHLALDLRAATYLDHECLLYIVGLLAHRRDAKLTTRLRLPEAENTLDFLNAWNFPSTVERVLRQPFIDLLDQDDAKLYLASAARPSKYIDTVHGRFGGREALLPVRFVAITPIDLDEDAERAATLVKAHWLQNQLKDLLDETVGYGELMASDVIYEAVRNAAMHPNASMAYHTSQVNARPRPSRLPVLTGEKEYVFAIWDNGASFEQTLTAGKAAFGRITSPSYGLVDETFRLSIRNSPGDSPQSEVVVVNSDVDPGELDDKLAFAAFLLGVTATPLRVPEHSEGAKRAVNFDPSIVPYSGLGLHAIRTTIVDLLHGELLYATEDLRVHIARGTDQGDYQVTIRRIAPSGPVITGNLLVARARFARRG